MQIITTLFLCLGLAGAALAQSADHPPQGPLVVAIDIGYAPFAMKSPAGGTEGFNVDIAREMARRLKRPHLEIVDTRFNVILAGLYSKRYEMIMAPIFITEQRAKEMLFTEPYLDSGTGFVYRKSDKIKTVEDLRGKRMTVSTGTVQDRWLTENADKFKFTIQRYNENADGVQAVLANRADVNAAAVQVAKYAASRQPRLESKLALADGNRFGFALRKESGAFRAEVDRQIECMKQDGTLARIYEKWFGEAPAADSSTAKTYPGAGMPGLEGYDPAGSKAACA
jgi:polar amino acid transport system substrate-binding protein